MTKRRNGIVKTRTVDRLFIQQLGCCLYCDKALLRKECTLDHIVPGFNHPINYSVSCDDCNHIKSGFFLFNGIHNKKITEEIVYRTLIMQLYVMKQFINHLWE